MTGVARYNPWLVVLHWVLAVFIMGSLLFGFFLLEPTPNTEPRKLFLLKAHMAGGMLILALMILRWVVRALTSKPQPVLSGHARLDRLAPLVHMGFYLLVISMAATGLATAIIARLNKIVFQGSGEPLPAQFDAYPTFIAHSYLAMLLIGLITLHVVAVLYHQLIRKDGIIGRMRLGQR